MARVVDTSVLLDVHFEDPEFGADSAECLAQYLVEGLVISPVTYIELAPAFAGDRVLLEQFLVKVGVEWREAWTQADTEEANRLWAEDVAAKRSGASGKRPVADVMIEAFALRFGGLITRTPRHFKHVP